MKKQQYQSKSKNMLAQCLVLFGICTGVFLFSNQSARAATTGSVMNFEMEVASGVAVQAKTEVLFDKEEYTVPYAWYKTIVADAFDDNMEEVKVTYQSSDEKIATVDKDGKITGVSVGDAIITAKAEDGSGAFDTILVHIQKEKKGWHTTATGKKYYIYKTGERATGYKKIKKKSYYFQKSGYMLCNKWKTIAYDGRKYKLYFGEDGVQLQDVLDILGAQSSYHIEVNTKKNIVVVYAPNKKKDVLLPVKAMVCSCGVKGHSTRTGTYSRLSLAGKWHTLYYGTYGQYCTRISGPYLFHSVVYKKNGDKYSLYAEEYNKLGENASHGCVRLQVKDAKWIYENYNKCSVTLFSSKQKVPLEKPSPGKAVKLENGKAYDPTDDIEEVESEE